MYNGWGQNKPSYDIYEEMRKDGEGNARLIRSILEYNQNSNSLERLAVSIPLLI